MNLVENTDNVTHDTEKKNFIVVMKELEKQKNEEIQSFRNNNKALEQKNKQLMGMLTILESKLN